MLYNYLPAAIQYLLATYVFDASLVPHTSSPQPLTFSLRHAYGLSNTTRTVFTDLDNRAFASESFSFKPRRLRTHKPKSQSAFFNSRVLGRQARAELLWDDIEVDIPDVEDRETLLMLAKMTNNAYYEPGETGWYDLGPDWNNSYPFGWEPDADGFRGHIFATEDNSTVIISVKGTSAGWVVGGGGPTSRKDKLNDNLLFSCCCARVGPTWSPVCGCYEGSYKCDQNCLEDSLKEDSLFYPIGTNLYNNVTYMYPEANIWVIGHSLGGSLASLIGVTFGAPVVAFEAPGERLAAQRLHLPSPPSTQHITHVYNTGDPIPLGACTGVASTCALGGFALETGCHLGKVIKYDTVSKLGWSVNIRNHGIAVVIDYLLSKDWEFDDGDGGQGGEAGKDKKKRTVPRLTEEKDCVDCFQWEFGDFRNASTRFTCSV